MPTPGVLPWLGDLEPYDGVSELVLVVDEHRRIAFANTAARRAYALGEDLSELTLAAVLLPEGEADLFAEITPLVLAGRQWTGRMDVRGADGSVRSADVSVTALRHAGSVAGLVCVVDVPAGPRGHERRARRLEDRLTRLARVAADLGSATDVESVTEVVVGQAADAVGATVASLSVVLDEDTLALVGLRGGKAGASERWARFSRDSRTPVADVVRSGRVLVIRGPEEIAAAYPDIEPAAKGSRTLVCLPLNILGQTLGAITLSFPGHRELDAAELEFFGILADSCAQAMERIRARQAAEVEAARVRFLANATTELSASLDHARTLASVARLTVPVFADWCAIDLVEDDRLHRLAVEHVDPAKVRLAVELAHRYPPARDVPGGAWEVMRTGRSSLLSEITDETLAAAAEDEQHLQMMRDLDLRSALLVPLVARGQVLGVITWVSAESGRRYHDTDVAFAEDLARRCAIAIDNSLLHSQTSQVAARLQEAVLPDLTEIVVGWEIGHLYDAAGRTEVGGDFFDVFELPDGRLAIFVGDVMGRGVAAAAAMAQMRAWMRAFIAVDPTPKVVLDKLDVLFETYGVTQLVTLVYLVADVVHDELVIVNAGHPPPVVVRRDGTAAQTRLADSGPVGVESGERTVELVPFGPGDAVIAFTDGLIERRGEDIDVGQQRLLDAVGLLEQGPLNDALPRLVEAVRDHTRDDDVAALVARRPLG